MDRKFVFIFFLSFLSVGFASQPSSRKCCEAQAHKIYVSSEKLFPTDSGLYLQLENEEYIQIPTLYSDAQGCYLLSYDSKVTKKCPLCGWQRFSGAFKCPNPDCSSNRKSDPDEEPSYTEEILNS